MCMFCEFVREQTSVPTPEPGPDVPHARSMEELQEAFGKLGFHAEFTYMDALAFIDALRFLKRHAKAHGAEPVEAIVELSEALERAWNERVEFVENYPGEWENAIRVAEEESHAQAEEVIGPMPQALGEILRELFPGLPMDVDVKVFRFSSPSAHGVN